jgi:hypothetical protein
VNHPTIKFRPTLVNQIRHGRKTQARRPVRYSKHIDGRTGRPRRTMRPCPLKENDVVQLVEVDEQPCAWDDLSAAERVRYAKLGFGPGATIYRQQESPCEADFIRIEGTPAEQAGHVHPEQYVYSLGGALRGERDAVDPQTLSDYARQNRDKDRVRKLERMAGRLDDKRSIDERLAEYRRMGLSTRDTERLIQRKLKELEDKARRAA